MGTLLKELNVPGLSIFGFRERIRKLWVNEDICFEGYSKIVRLKNANCP